MHASDGLYADKPRGRREPAGVIPQTALRVSWGEHSPQRRDRSTSPTRKSNVRAALSPGDGAAARIPQLPSVPLLRDGTPIGLISVTRAQPGSVRRASRPAAADFCRPGRHRDRECAAVQRDQGGAGAADRDRRHPEGDRQLALGRAAGLRGDRDQRQPADRRLLDRGAAALSTTRSPGGLHADQPGGRCGAASIVPQTAVRASWGEQIRDGELVAHPRHLNRSGHAAGFARPGADARLSQHAPCAADARPGADRFDQCHAGRARYVRRPSRRSCSRLLPTRPSSRSRIRGCSTRPGRRWSGRPLPPTS